METGVGIETHGRRSWWLRIGQLDTLRPRSDAGDAREMSVERREARVDSAVLNELAQTRSDRGAHPEASIKGISCDWRAFLLCCQPRCRFLHFRVARPGSKAQPINRPRAAGTCCAVVPLCEPTVGGARLNNSGQVRGQGTSARQCSEEEPLAETANHLDWTPISIPSP